MVINHRQKYVKKHYFLTTDEKVIGKKVFFSKLFFDSRYLFIYYSNFFISHTVK